MDRQTLGALFDGRQTTKFSTPQWWPDEANRLHLKLWLEQAESGEPPPALWGPRAIVLDGRMIGHAGFHRPPSNIHEALGDPTFHGALERSPGGVVEIGYTVFPRDRSNGYGTEATGALVDWAYATEQVSTILATVAPDNVASLSVLDNVGGFHKVGTSQGDTGHHNEIFRRDEKNPELPAGKRSLINPGASASRTSPG